ncbi:hypothetical protein NK214_05595 [Chromobacterium sp. S0633]|uniref:hypothetical protein n=1 Tax=Chromobacterium sp. S0633 TaxID=2957805 RepID=UPI00209E5D1A|nr:hypothetical protein [Chromobacterium sp. S0633]MCP1289660.1 hypothetical protein [Chromobacterium sp. S0633]
MEEGYSKKRFWISRRDFIRYSVVLGGCAVSGCAELGAGRLSSGEESGSILEFFVVREEDELFLRVKAVGFRMKPGSRILDPALDAVDHLLVFEIPPQQFSEPAIALPVIPEVLDEQYLRAITLSPSVPGRLVFRVPPRPMPLRVESLLAWEQFEALFPDLNTSGTPYDLEVPLNEQKPLSRVEMLWGIEFAPENMSQRLIFTGSSKAKSERGWTELWSSALRPSSPPGQTPSLPMEIFSIRGFTRTTTTGAIATGDLVVTYKTNLGDSLPAKSPPIENWERAEFAANLSRRFTYTGKICSLGYTAKIRLVDESTTFNASYAAGRALQVDQYRISGRGGYLDLHGQWAPFPGSALSGLTVSTTGGRYNHVEIVRRGFLYPFGTPCELVTLSDRVFAKDSKGHFVAPLIKQVFLRIPQPNSVTVGHTESPFVYLSVLTPQTLPLDLPPSGDPSDYGRFDYFLPTVNGIPFAFEHVGTDWGGDTLRASMPLVFVSNASLAPNGLIWEPGYPWAPDTAGAPPASPHTIPRGGDGFRVVDKLWALQAGRFAQYGGVTVSLAGGQSKGDTAQKVEWIEWTRGNIPDLAPCTAMAAPFRPRARTMRLRLHATEYLSDEPSAILATYRDIRFTSAPFLDPEPTTPANIYFTNVTSGSSDPDLPYIYVLETRPLAPEVGTPASRAAAQVAMDIRDLYFRVSDTGHAPPTSLFAGINNEVRFGATASAEGVGGLTVPDTHLSALNRRLGLVGDATFNERRWPGFAAMKSKLAAAHRLDFAAYAQTQRAPLDQAPFDHTVTPADRAAAVAAARSMMGFPAAAAQAPALSPEPRLGSTFAPELKLGDLFGIDAQLIPGMRFSDLFSDVPLAGSPESVAPLSGNMGTNKLAAEPLAWNVKLTGIEWLTKLQTQADAAAILSQLLPAIVAEARPDSAATPLSMGVEATLSWSNNVFFEKDIGPAKFVPTGDTSIEIDAVTRVDLGVVMIEGDPPNLSFAPGKPTVTASTSLRDFSVEVFSAIRLNFSSVSFNIAADGSKTFSPKLASVDLLPPLDFINQVQSLFGGLGGGSQIRVDISPQRAKILQTLAFPTNGEPLFIGPAQVTNLTLSWAVTVPLMGRDVLSASFAIASREKPLTIFVPPWYGGKAYLLLEVTTRGCRLVEFSMEYGALIPITWSGGLATGQASLTAGLFYLLQQDDAHDSGQVVLAGFVKASANLTVAGIIQFYGLIYISLSYVIDANGRLIRGEAGVSVSIKIGFVRVSYTFTAKHEERQHGGQAAHPTMSGGAATHMRLVATEESKSPLVAPISAIAPFGEGFSIERRRAFETLLAGYRSGGLQ